VNEDQIATIVLDEAFRLHKNLGPGLLESVYETVMVYELKNRGLNPHSQVSVPFVYNNVRFEKSFVADIIVNECVILEIKSLKSNHELHRMQLLSYLKVANKKLWLVLNFGMRLMREGISRVVNGL